MGEETGKRYEKIEDVMPSEMAKELVKLPVGGSRTVEKQYAIDVISELYDIIDSMPKIKEPKGWVGNPPAGIAFYFVETRDGKVQIFRAQ